MARSTYGAIAKSALYSGYGLNHDSGLNNLFRAESIPVCRLFMMSQLLLIVKKLILKTSNYVSSDGTVCVLGQALRDALQIHSLHISQLSYILLKHVSLIKKRSFRANLRPKHVKFDPFALVEFYPDSHRYFISDRLRTVLGFLIPNRQRMFRFVEAYRYLNQYILSKPLTDPTNVNMLLIKGDPLESVFDVEALNKQQLRSYLQAELTSEYWCTCKAR